MKKLFCLLFSVLMLLSLVACGGESTDDPATTTVSNVPSEIHCTITVIGKNGDVKIDKQPIILRDKQTWPTVLDALAQACDAYELKLVRSEDGLGVESIANQAATYSGDIFYWEWTKDGKAVSSGRAGNTEVTEGSAYVFTYTQLATEG